MYNLLTENRLDEILTVRAEEIENFDPARACIDLQPLVRQRTLITLSIARTLFIAHQFYSELGKEKRSLNLKQISEVDLPEGYRSFQEFCTATRIARSTSYYILEKFVPGSTPEEDRLLTPEELAEIKAQEKAEEFKRIGRLVMHYRQTGEYLPGWDCKCDHYLEKQLEQDPEYLRKRIAYVENSYKSQQLELDFDGVVEGILAPAQTVEARIAKLEELIQKLQEKLESYRHPRDKKIQRRAK